MGKFRLEEVQGSDQDLIGYLMFIMRFILIGWDGGCEISWIILNILEWILYPRLKRHIIGMSDEFWAHNTSHQISQEKKSHKKNSIHNTRKRKKTHRKSMTESSQTTSEKVSTKTFFKLSFINDSTRQTLQFDLFLLHCDLSLWWFTVSRKVVWFNLMIRYELSELRWSKINHDIRCRTRNTFFHEIKNIFSIFEFYSANFLDIYMHIFRISNFSFHKPNCRLYSAYRAISAIWLCTGLMFCWKQNT